MQTATWVHIGYKLRGNVQISKSLPSNSALERRASVHDEWRLVKKECFYSALQARGGFQCECGARRASKQKRRVTLLVDQCLDILHFPLWCVRLRISAASPPAPVVIDHRVAVGQKSCQAPCRFPVC